jgi:hypothetical protein
MSRTDAQYARAMASDDLASFVRDPDLPAADILLSPYAAADALTPAVAPDGGIVRQAALREVDYYPGRSVNAAYDAVVEWSDTTTTEILGVVARYDNRTRGDRVTEIAGISADLWRYPDDPYLPGLRSAIDPAYAEEVLEAAGLMRGVIRFEVHGYAPRNRAVVEVKTEPISRKLTFRSGQGLVAPEPEALLFIKVLRTERVDSLVAAHEALEGVIPVPRALHVDRERALLGISPMPGVPLWETIVDGTYRPLDAGELLDVLSRIEDVPVEKDSRMSPTQSVRLNIPALRALLPGRAAALERFEERLGEEDAPQPEITVHGDFHEYQLLVNENGLSGVLDLDDVGRGYRVDDMAMMLGRVWAFSRTERQGGPALERYFWSLLETFEPLVDGVELRRRIAAVCMNHALQPFRYQEPTWRARCARGVDIAEELLSELLPSAAAS